MAYFRCGGGADTSIVTAVASDVLSPKVIVDAEGNPLTGTMPNNGAVSPSALNCGGSYTIPAGYHNGGGKVTANSLASQTNADAVAGNILTGKTAWVNGSKVTGTMANRGAVTQTLNAGGSYTIPAGYHNGSGKVTANSLSSQGALKTLTGSFSNAANNISYGTSMVLGTIAGVTSSPKHLIIVTNGTGKNPMTDSSSTNASKLQGIRVNSSYYYTGNNIGTITQLAFLNENTRLCTAIQPFYGVHGSDINSYDSSTWYPYVFSYTYSSNTITITVENKGSNSEYKLGVAATKWNYLVVF